MNRHGLPWGKLWWWWLCVRFIIAATKIGGIKLMPWIFLNQRIQLDSHICGKWRMN